MFVSRWMTLTCRNIEVPSVTRLCDVISALTRAGTRPHSCRNGTKRTPMVASNANAMRLSPIRQTVTCGHRPVFTS